MADQIPTKIGVVVVKIAISFPCKYLKAFIKHKYIIPNWIAPINRAFMCFFRFKFLKNGKNNKVAISNLEKTTNSDGSEESCSFISPKDKENNTVAIIK